MRIVFNKLMVSVASALLRMQMPLVLALLGGVMLSVHVGAGIDAVQASFAQRWGATSQSRFDAWRKLLPSLSELGDADRLKRVNSFVNQQVQFGEDTSVWGQTDYWATPVETLGRGAGDCEDFAIAKYFTLLQVGMAPDKLRFIYVRAKTGTSDATQAHMVLAFYATPDAEPLVMDNLVGEIKLASRRPDLVPVFSFNSTGVFTGAAGASPAAGGTGRLSRWEDLLRRAKAEGFE
ncbi:MAG: transglutaminase-like cysteine peptidase [Rhodoferax sp.]|uniref:transglutaminase-like cysteine peptidase n=1 Tax=Rhodoferax sp. TaxID=50421 RepID=UPI002ACD6162|nr:transglutaminase-like cysteine peptidase [Rhodoferax sp.]MDZ7890829.1 transglutaminase-like cysteine peptidase [Rhodoferax sp.]